MANELIKYDQSQIELFRKTIAPTLTADELKLAIAISERTGLDLLSRQLYAIKRKSKGVEKMTMQTGIDGYRAIADRQGDYAGSDDGLYDEGLNQFQMIKAGRATPTTATVTVYKLVGGVRCPFTATATWAGYFPGEGESGFMWRKFPYLMLAKCAEALALRKGWAAHMHGVYVQEEMEQAYSGEAETRSIYQRPADVSTGEAAAKAAVATAETRTAVLRKQDHSQVEPPVEFAEGDYTEENLLNPPDPNVPDQNNPDGELSPPIEAFTDKRDELCHFCQLIEKKLGLKEGDALFDMSCFTGKDGGKVWMRDPYKPGLKETWINPTLHKAHIAWERIENAENPQAVYEAYLAEIAPKS